MSAQEMNIFTTVIIEDDPNNEEMVVVQLSAGERAIAASVPWDSLLDHVESGRRFVTADANGRIRAPRLSANDPGLPLNDPDRYAAVKPEVMWGYNLDDMVDLIVEAARELRARSETGGSRIRHHKSFRAAIRALRKPLGEWVDDGKSGPGDKLPALLNCLDAALAKPSPVDPLCGAAK